jgi:hypothetical protein
VKEPLVHLMADAVFTMGILALLAIFWEGIQWLKFRGYDTDKLDKLHSLHFAIAYLALLVLGIAFLVKLGALLWKKR